ncbi:MAG: putative RNA methyltransferase [Planctomycetota bacterium]
MFPLRCTVRNCQKRLIREDRGLLCATGHRFDQAREGYWNLLQPQDRKSKNPGDSDEAVLARQRWLQRGHMAGLIETLASWISQRAVSSPVLDLGCGEGTFGTSLFAGFEELYCGIDLSKRAIRLAARRSRDATWVLCNADRTLPAEDQSVGCVMSLFGRRPAEEIARVLSGDGLCVIAVPGEDDLFELREQVQRTGKRRNRWQAVADTLTEVGLELVEQITWRNRVHLNAPAIADAMAMTYRAVRHSEQAKLQSIESMEVSLSAELLLMRRR